MFQGIKNLCTLFGCGLVFPYLGMPTLSIVAVSQNSKSPKGKDLYTIECQIWRSLNFIKTLYAKIHLFWSFWPLNIFEIRGEVCGKFFFLLEYVTAPEFDPILHLIYLLLLLLLFEFWRKIAFLTSFLFIKISRWIIELHDLFKS